MQVSTWGEVELVAMVMGGVDALESAARAVDAMGGTGGLLGQPPEAITARTGLSPTRAVRLLAAVELGRRALAAQIPDRVVLDGPEAAARVFTPRLAGLAHEEFHAAYLDRRLRLLDVRRLTSGSDQYTVVDPRQVLRPAVHLGASWVVVAHNHPSGDLSASQQDVDITRRLAAAGAAIQIPIVDHLILANGGWRSLALEGQMPPQSPTNPWVAHAARQ